MIAITSYIQLISTQLQYVPDIISLKKQPSVNPLASSVKSKSKVMILHELRFDTTHTQSGVKEDNVLTLVHFIQQSLRVYFDFFLRQKNQQLQ